MYCITMRCYLMNGWFILMWCSSQVLYSLALSSTRDLETLICICGYGILSCQIESGMIKHTMRENLDK